VHKQQKQECTNKQNIILDEQIINVVTYGIMALLHLTLFLIKFYKTKGKDKVKLNIRFVLDALNLVFMYHGVCMMKNKVINFVLPGIMVTGRFDINTLKMIYVTIVFVIAGINIPVNIPVKDMEVDKIHYYLYNNIYIYTSMKFAILLFYSLEFFNTSSLIISIYMITYATVCIILGFRYKLMGKSLRIFGLVMTLVFVIKIIVIDITFSSSISRAIGYFVNGILCFSISAIYNYFEKKTVDKTKNITINVMK